jgi:hypothetical protein
MILNLKIHQMDEKTVCLHGDLLEEIYMNSSEGLVDIEPSEGQVLYNLDAQGANRNSKYKKGSVCRLNHILYGLKQSSWMWN